MDCGNDRDLTWVWLFEAPPLFRPFAADPRARSYGAGWRWNDNAIAKNTIPISFADSFPIIRFYNIGPYNDQIEITLEGGLWGIFDPCDYSAPLINADYFAGFPITYNHGCWTFRLRGYHISSHLGDEFLLYVKPEIDRKNPSAEYVDFFASYEITDEIRLYGGGGVLIHQDPSFRCGSWYAECGMEVRIYQIGFVSSCDLLYVTPFYAMHFRYSPGFKNHLDQTYRVGYEIGKLCGLQRRVRAFLEYHDGYSLEGQFCKQPTNYFSVGLSYGY